MFTSSRHEDCTDAFLEGLGQQQSSNVCMPLPHTVKPDLGSFSNRFTRGGLDAVAGSPDAPEPETFDVSVLSSSKFDRCPGIELRDHDLLPFTSIFWSCRDLERRYGKSCVRDGV